MKAKFKFLLSSILIVVLLLQSTAFANEEDGSQQATDTLNLQTPYVVLMEASTGTVIYEKNSHEQRPPASVTKVMTLLLIFEAVESGKIKMDDLVTTSAHAKSMGGSQVFLEEGEQQTVETLVKCIVIASGNDAAVAMAEYIGGTEDGFVQMMNQRAKELGMTDTNFVDCCGLTEDANHYSSAADIAIMSRELITRFPWISDYATVWMEDITHTTAKGSSQFTLTNTNKLIRQYEGCTGLKTGFTSTAKYCLSATASKNGIAMIVVVLASPDSKTRFAETAGLFNYGYSKCSLYMDTPTEIHEPITINKGKDNQVNVMYNGDFSYLSLTGEDFTNIEKKLEIADTINAPFDQGTTVGQLTYFLDGKEIGRLDVVTENGCEAAGFGDCLYKVISRLGHTFDL